MLHRSVFDFEDYRDYLRAVLPVKGEKRGTRTLLAEFLNCQSAFVSRVLKGLAHFSLEHGYRISVFLEHSEQEREYFLLLLHAARAGSGELKQHYESQRARLLKKRETVIERILPTAELPLEDQIHYFGTWHQVAIHMMLAIPRFQVKEAIAEHLRLPLSTVTRALDFLVSHGLAVYEAGRYKMTARRIHLPPESPIVPVHEANWKSWTISTLGHRHPEDLSYCTVISISEESARKMKALLLNAIEEAEVLVNRPDEEALFHLNVALLRV